MAHKAEPPNEHELDTYRKREGRNEVIRNLIALAVVLLLVGWVWNLQGNVNEAKVLAAAGSEQFTFCQKTQNEDTKFCQKPIVTVGKDGPTGPRGPQGLSIPGDDGRDGRDGQDGSRGPRGFPGADSNVPGPQGPAGADSTVPGPPGADGSNGNDGAPGPACPDGYSPQLRTVTTVENGPEVVSVCIED